MTEGTPSLVRGETQLDECWPQEIKQDQEIPTDGHVSRGACGEGEDMGALFDALEARVNQKWTQHGGNGHLRAPRSKTMTALVHRLHTESSDPLPGGAGRYPILGLRQAKNASRAQEMPAGLDERRPGMRGQNTAQQTDIIRSKCRSGKANGSRTSIT